MSNLVYSVFMGTTNMPWLVFCTKLEKAGSKKFNYIACTHLWGGCGSDSRGVRLITV